MINVYYLGIDADFCCKKPINLHIIMDWLFTDKKVIKATLDPNSNFQIYIAEESTTRDY